MPCMDGGPSPESNYRYEYQEAARAACEMAKALRALDRYTFENLSFQTLAWIERHDEIDRAREKRERKAAEREAARKSALSKLSPEERAALGFK